MAEKMGGKLIYGLGVFLTSILTVISPFAAYWGLVPFLVVRVAEGFTEVNILLLIKLYTCIRLAINIFVIIQGVTFPAMHSMLAHWVPPLERSKFAAIVYAGIILLSPLLYE